MTHTVIWVAGEGGNPAWEDTPETAFGGRWANHNVITVPFPKSRFPIAIDFIETMMAAFSSADIDSGLGSSVSEGIVALDSLVRAITGPKIVVGVSQGAFVVHEVQNMYVNDVTAPPVTELEFWYVGDAAHPQRAGLRKADWTFPPPNGYSVPIVRKDSIYNTVQVVREYDGVCDWPDSPQLWPAIQNAISGAQRLHGRGYNVDLDSLPLSQLSVEVNDVGANITTYLIPTPELPMLQWMRNAHVHPTIVEVDTEDKLKPRVDQAYNRRVSKILRPNAATITLTGGQPAVLNPYVARPAARVLTLTGGAPHVMVGDRLVVPMAGVLTLTGGRPVVSPRIITPQAGKMLLTGGRPLVRTPRILVPTRGLMQLNGGRPDVPVSPAAVVKGFAPFAGNQNYTDATATFHPYTPQLGDVVYIMRLWSGTGVTVSPPAGWVNALGSANAKVEGLYHGFCVVYHVVTASEVSSGAINFNAYGVINKTSRGPSLGWVVRGGDPANPIDAIETRIVNTVSTTQTFPPLPPGSVQSQSLPLALAATYTGGTTAYIYTFSNVRTTYPLGFEVADVVDQPNAVVLSATLALHNLVHP